VLNKSASWEHVEITGSKLPNYDQSNSIMLFGEYEETERRDVSHNNKNIPILLLTW
jgi:hypothetical protein